MLSKLHHLFSPASSEAPPPNINRSLRRIHLLAVKTVEHVSTVVMGKPRQIRLAVACLLAGGHLLIEDVPGVGKTTLAHSLVNALGLQFARVQFTSDLLPGDILGSSVYDRESQTFVFHPGPAFTQVLLADEINRASPKAQSALLEAMEEGQVTIDGTTRLLPKPFFVIATQNPSTQLGTFPLPESQLDRFLMCISLGYPDEQSEKEMMKGKNPRKKLDGMTASFGIEELIECIDDVEKVHVSDALIDYVYRIVHATRGRQDFEEGLSPRSVLGLLSAGRAWALMEGREAVLPDDIQVIYPYVAVHRLRCRTNQGGFARNSAHFHAEWLKKIPSEG